MRTHCSAMQVRKRRNFGSANLGIELECIAVSLRYRVWSGWRHTLELQLPALLPSGDYGGLFAGASVRRAISETLSVDII